MESVMDKSTATSSRTRIAEGIRASVRPPGDSGAPTKTHMGDELFFAGVAVGVTFLILYLYATAPKSS